MKKYALGAAALILSCISWSVAAADKPTLEERCRAIAKQHGMPAEEVDAWVEKCLDRTKAMMARHPQGEQKPPHEDKSGLLGVVLLFFGCLFLVCFVCVVVVVFLF